MRPISMTTALVPPVLQALVMALAFPGIAHGAELSTPLVVSTLLRTAALAAIAWVALRLGARLLRQRAPQPPPRVMGYGLERRTPVGGRPPRRAPGPSDPDWSAIVKRRPLPDNAGSRPDPRR